ncbi:MAG: uncharacterized protein KVP18_000022 [Porospora cf. gigantea A]|uniref:uncharacterized protein n=1 Tax=Porospora cf. gigantea A TaxID=2853593 RepID=UPI00355AB0AE|nr:MAG: hypothetical protein KVP18_000022 [Porospora cf. gigantea A]
MFYGTGVVSRSMATFTAFSFVSRIFTFLYWAWDPYIRGENGIPGRSFHIVTELIHMLILFDFMRKYVKACCQKEPEDPMPLALPHTNIV